MFDDLSSIIREKIDVEDNKVHILKTQDVSQILEANRRQARDDPKMNGDAKFRFVGRIPLVLAEKWSLECKCGLGTKEYTAFVKKKLKDSNYAYLRVHKW
jgi:hypothetical protein